MNQEEYKLGKSAKPNSLNQLLGLLAKQVVKRIKEKSNSADDERKSIPKSDK